VGQQRVLGNWPAGRRPGSERLDRAQQQHPAASRKVGRDRIQAPQRGVRAVGGVGTDGRLFWVAACRLCVGWRRQPVLAQPEPVRRWHRQGAAALVVALPAAHGAAAAATGGPRPDPPPLGRDPAGGTERIRGDLLQLGSTGGIGGDGAIRRSRWRAPAEPPRQSWRTFPANHARAIWGADRFVVQTLAFTTRCGLRCIRYGRRELVHLAVTAHPTAAWVWRPMGKAPPGARARRTSSAIAIR
jgi:hypothetical protein